MPACLNRDSSRNGLFNTVNVPRGKPRVEFRGSEANCIDIGLINNMPDGALRSTERQFLTLLDTAADGVLVRLSLYALPGVPRNDSARAHINKFYSGIEDLWDRHLDGLIVTGTEPRAASLTDEPFWVSMTKVLDWAGDNTLSTIWSCLAAHAALLQSDGIVRRRLSEKRYGLFECERVSDHPLLAGTPSRLVTPHSRGNDIPEHELVDHGYSILTRTKQADADMFVKQKKSLFVFFQGHPEYESNTLLLEYGKAIGRYRRRESDTYPAMPEGYFDADTADALTEVRRRAISGRREEVLADFPMMIADRNLAHTWRPAATCIYRNWLAHLSALKKRRLKERRDRKGIAGSRC